MQTDINEYLDRDMMSLTDWEDLLLSGWDRVGSFFFHRRFDVFRTMFEDTYITYQLMPLRYNLHNFTFTKSQRKIQRQNEDLKRIYRPTVIDDEKLELFDNWYLTRFYTEGSIFTWVSDNEKPFPTHEVSIYKDDKLIACSFFDITPKAQYSTLAMYSPDERHRSLGTYTLISEIEMGLMHHKNFHFPGHAYYENSVYDYKKRFNNMECFDWETTQWQPLPR